MKVRHTQESLRLIQESVFNDSHDREDVYNIKKIGFGPITSVMVQRRKSTNGDNTITDKTCTPQPKSSTNRLAIPER